MLRKREIIEGNPRVEAIWVLYHACNYSIDNVARVFGVSKQRIHEIMKKNGILRRRRGSQPFTLGEWQKFTVKLMAELRQNRYTLKRIGKLIGVSDMYVFTILKDHEVPELSGTKGRLLKPEDIFSGKLPCYRILRKWVLLVLPHVCNECGKGEKETKKLYVVQRRKYPRSFLDFRILCHGCRFMEHAKFLYRRRKILKKAREMKNGER